MSETFKYGGHVYQYHSGLMQSSANISKIFFNFFPLYSHYCESSLRGYSKNTSHSPTEGGPSLSSGTCSSSYLNLRDITVHSATPVGNISLTCFPSSVCPWKSYLACAELFLIVQNTFCSIFSLPISSIVWPLHTPPDPAPSSSLLLKPQATVAL